MDFFHYDPLAKLEPSLTVPFPVVWAIADAVPPVSNDSSCLDICALIRRFRNFYLLIVQFA